MQRTILTKDMFNSNTSADTKIAVLEERLSSYEIMMKKIDEGYTFDNFKHVIDVKTAKWKGTDMEDYLRPQTLFGSKFNAYLNELPNNGKQQTSSIQQTIDTAQRVAESIDWGVDTE